MPIKIFLSWSGTTSHKVACAFREWLPSVIQSVQPYVSSEDIDKGTRWSTDIARELEQSRYGILCITSDNLNAPWVCFEAGALSKTIDKANVTPFLFDVKRSEVQGPLLQFQSALFEGEEVYKLLKSINGRIEDGGKLSDQQLRRSFDVWWDDLKQSLLRIKESQAPITPSGSKQGPNKDEILEEILELSRKQQRILTDPESLFPPGYFEVMFREFGRHRHSSGPIYRRLHETTVELETKVKSIATETADAEKILVLAREIHMLVHELEVEGPRMRSRRSSIEPTSSSKSA